MEAAQDTERLLRDFPFQPQSPEMLSQPPSEVWVEVVLVNFGHGLEVGATRPLRPPLKHLLYIYLRAIHLRRIRIQYKHLQSSSLRDSLNPDANKKSPARSGRAQRLFNKLENLRDGR